MTKYFEEESKSTKQQDEDAEDKVFAIPPLFGTTTLRVFLFLHQMGN